MSDEHEHHDHAHPHDAPVTADAGSQALAEALGSSFAIVKIVMGLMVVAFFCSGFFTVGPQEKAVILRFGKPVGEGQKALLTAGLHWSLPYPIDEVVRIPITEIQKVSSNNGWYFTTPEAELSGEEMPAGASLNPAIDGYVITADRNIIHTRATLFYHIDDPIRVMCSTSQSASNTVQNALDNALLYTAAKFNVDDILDARRGRFSRCRASSASPIWSTRSNSALSLTSCEVQSIAPRQLQGCFRPSHHRAGKPEQAAQRRPQLREPGHEPVRRARHVHHQRRCRRHARATSNPSPPRRNGFPTCCRNTKPIQTCSCR